MAVWCNTRSVFENKFRSYLVLFEQVSSFGHKSSVSVGHHLLLFSRVVWRCSCLHQESSALDRKFFLENFIQFLSLPGVIQRRLSSFVFLFVCFFVFEGERFTGEVLCVFSTGVIMFYWRSLVFLSLES